jgi:hypothetical protein
MYDMPVELANESDPSDPDYGPPETWGPWADWDTIELGPAFFREECLDDPDALCGEDSPLSSPPDEWPITNSEDLLLLKQVALSPYSRWLSQRAEVRE